MSVPTDEDLIILWQKRLAMTATIAAKPTPRAGEAAAHVQVVPHGGRLKAVAVDLVRLSQLPVHRKDAPSCLLPPDTRRLSHSALRPRPTPPWSGFSVMRRNLQPPVCRAYPELDRKKRRGAAP